MFKRKLISLDFYNPTGFNHADESQYRSLVVWLEDQKIRHYKIEDRAGLRNMCAGDWEKSLQKYLEDLGCPMNVSERTGVLDWLLGYAVRLEYGDNIDKYKNAKAPSTSSGTVKQSTNPLDNLDFNDPEFKAGVLRLAAVLQIPPHPDHMVQLKAICIIIREKLSKEALEKLKLHGIKHGSSIPLESIEVAFETPDYITAEAAKILRLLHIRELRDLQSDANQCIVAVQSMTADPRTDTKLGKVGRL